MAPNVTPSPFNTTTSSRRDISHLLPSNRKLRNLVSLSLRNLSLTSTSSTSPSHHRQRGKTIDDDALPTTLVSPAKLVALREQRDLGHSRSSSDLRSVAEDNAAIQSGTEMGNGSATKSTKNARSGGLQRPSLKKLRRRSTLEWASASPARRQIKLESVTASHLADVFFALHVDGVEEPVWVSETIERTMNPTFRHVDWSACGPGVTRLERVVVKIWVRSVKIGHWRLLLEMNVAMGTLVFLGKNLDTIHQPLPQNAVIFHLTDGVYTSFPPLSPFDSAPQLPPGPSLSRSSTTRTLSTSSFDALLRLAKLDDSIQDALATRNKIAADLEKLLQANNEALTNRDKLAEAEDRLKTIDYAKKTVSKQLDKARKQQEEKRNLLRSRRDLMAQDISTRRTAAEMMEKERLNLPGTRTEHTAIKKAVQNQRRRICEDLQNIYPLTSLPHKPLAFSIRNLYLPNSEDLDTEPPEKVAAALGHVAHVLLLLSFYLGQMLPYPISPRESTSTIYDPISLLKTHASSTQNYKDETALRTYPLFSKGVPRFRFEYAVFLLNKDIQILLESAFNVRVLDIRQTLPNLKYLLYVATAGEGELPARKAGGVRGLMRRAERAEHGPGGVFADGMERKGSQDSTSSALSGLLWHGGEGVKVGVGGKLVKGSGKADGNGGAVESLRRNGGKAAAGKERWGWG